MNNRKIAHWPTTNKQQTDVTNRRTHDLVTNHMHMLQHGSTFPDKQKRENEPTLIHAVLTITGIRNGIKKTKIRDHEQMFFLVDEFTKMNPKAFGKKLEFYAKEVQKDSTDRVALTSNPDAHYELIYGPRGKFKRKRALDIKVMNVKAMEAKARAAGKKEDDTSEFV